MQLSSSYNDRDLQIMRKRTHVESHTVIIFEKLFLSGKLKCAFTQQRCVEFSFTS